MRQKNINLFYEAVKIWLKIDSVKWSEGSKINNSLKRVWLNRKKIIQRAEREKRIKNIYCTS